MKNKLLQLVLGCVVLFCAASAHSQGYDTCAHLKYWAYKSSYYTDTAFYQMQYDSLRYYVERCAATDNTEYFVFNDLDNAVQLMSKDIARYDQYRAWLISVLYLKAASNPYHFCSCLGSIANTYQDGKYMRIAYLAVHNYMRQTHPCGWDSTDQAQYAKDSIDGALHGYDVINLPPLDSLGLGFLLNSGVKPTTTGIGKSYLASLTSSPNPFIKETTLQFTLNHMTYITVSIYDELGRLVWGDGRGSSLEAGLHSIHLDASSFPSGTLYARIATGFGEVKTVKLVHDK
jgi:hypothetical protein